MAFDGRCFLWKRGLIPGHTKGAVRGEGEPFAQYRGGGSYLLSLCGSRLLGSGLFYGQDWTKANPVAGISGHGNWLWHNYGGARSGAVEYASRCAALSTERCGAATAPTRAEVVQRFGACVE